MRITIFGAAGNLGSRIVTEALSRGHDITAVVRNPDRAHDLPAAVKVRCGDASDAARVAELSAGQDLVIGTTRPAPGSEHELPVMARALLAGTSAAGVRLLLVSGAGNLIVPGSGGTLAVDDPAIVPPAWRAIARACVEQLEVCRADSEANWTAISPAALLAPGKRTGHYRLGRDELLVDAEGKSSISMEDFAIAIVDEAEQPRHRRTRFTAGY